MSRIVSTLIAASAILLGLAAPAHAVSGVTAEGPDSRTQSTAKISTMLGVCTGTLISPSWVLTAAHCIEYFPRGDVGFGETGKEQRTRYTNVYLHPNPNIDLGLILLDEPVNEIPALPVSDKIPAENSEADIFGWGGEATTSGEVGKARVAVTNPDITHQISILSRSQYIDVETIDGSKIVSGDSGGPLFTAEDPETVSGVLSFKSREIPNTDHYTPTHMASDWINHTVETVDPVPTEQHMHQSFLGSLGFASTDIADGTMSSVIVGM